MAKAGVAVEVPRGAELSGRLGSVLEVVYLIFNEGYAATAGPSLVRPPLCAEAQRLARILAGLMPEQPEVLGLLALIEIQARSDEHTSELQSLMRISYAVFCLNKHKYPLSLNSSSYR